MKLSLASAAGFAAAVLVAVLAKQDWIDMEVFWQGMAFLGFGAGVGATTYQVGLRTPMPGSEQPVIGGE